MKHEVNDNNVVIFTGAGISAESGIPTFRDMGGLWNTYNIEEVASPEAWESHPQRVLDFYNERRLKALAALPNDAHRAIQSLEEAFNVVVITQNVDDLHERAGSSQVIHLHGELRNVNQHRKLITQQRPILTRVSNFRNLRTAPRRADKTRSVIPY